MGRKYTVHMGVTFSDALHNMLLACHATAQKDLLPGMSALCVGQCTQITEYTLFRMFSNGTGVHYDHIGTFSGIGQGLISILTPLVLPLLSSGMETTDKGYSASGFSKWAIICGIALVVFSSICVLSTKERNVVYNGEKFSFKKIFKVIKGNDQLVVFMIFAMISNAGWYLTSGTAVYYFTDVLGEPTAQSLFSTIGAVGSALGLVVIPILSKKFSNRTIYQISLAIAIVGYVMMFVFGPILGITIALDLSYTVASIGIGSMFVGQTIFLADIVDYGEFKSGTRNESITFSMKGFLQKMAYTIQTIFLFGGLGMMNYNEQILGGVINNSTKSAIGIVCFAVPPVLMVISLIIFRSKFRIYGELRNEIHDFIAEKRAKES
jgi:melibiose permease